MKRLAWLAANIINHRTPAWGEKRRKAVTMDDLLGNNKTAQVPEFSSPEELRAYMRAKREEAEKRAAMEPEEV